MINIPVRLLKAFLVAVILGSVFAAIARAESKQKPKDPGTQTVVVIEPSVCMFLEPYGWWWYFWDCGVLPTAR